MKYVTTTLAATAALVALTACGEKPQTIGGNSKVAPAYAGTGSRYMQPGWKAGDKASWEAQLKARQQNTQNEYPRISAK